jgi:CTP:molybdopterin cytidylyltransferase MocA
MISAILLAAGESARMGRPKALLPWADSTLIEYQIRELLAAGVEHVAVVLGHQADLVRTAVPREAYVVVNEAYRAGRASSLRAGAASLPDRANPILILNVDQPRSHDLLGQLLAEHAEVRTLATVPAYGERRGHPIIVSGALLPELRQASEAELGLRGVLAAHEDELREVDLGTPEVLLDINTEDDYRRARAGPGPAA